MAFIAGLFGLGAAGGAAAAGGGAAAAGGFTAASGIAGALGGIAPVAATGLTTAEIIGGGFTALSAISGVLGGISQAGALELEAEQAELQATSEALEGRRLAVNELEKLNEELGSRIALAGARGGAGVQGLRGIEAGGLANVDLARLGGQIRSRTARLQAEQLRRAGRISRRTGIIGGLGALGSSATRLIERRG